MIVVLISEIESLRSRLLEKDLEVEEARRSSLAPYKIWIFKCFQIIN